MSYVDHKELFEELERISKEIRLDRGVKDDFVKDIELLKTADKFYPQGEAVPAEELEAYLAKIAKLRKDVGRIGADLARAQDWSRWWTMAAGTVGLTMVGTSAVMVDLAVAVGSRFLISFGGLASSALGVVAALIAICALYFKIRFGNNYNRLHEVDEKLEELTKVN
ncbi:hypothetical protein [Leisingera aquaemixtae]|uniref:hypothetical protein n=1 Tax=Leisingera aquaemixtae TaxID=1396826 RepID=UPI00071C6474|nr:hypothetical protein [Leisingera aquaemixtae]